MKPSQLSTKEFAPYFNTYISLVDEIGIVKALKRSRKIVLKTLKNLPKEKEEYRYEASKWTIKEMLLHIIDNERIFINRALRFSRNDLSNIPGYEHNEYVQNSMANNRNFKDLIKAYKAQRKSSILFFKGLEKEMLTNIGSANDMQVSVRAIGYILAGHDVHHCKIIKERYL